MNSYPLTAQGATNGLGGGHPETWPVVSFRAQTDETTETIDVKPTVRRFIVGVDFGTTFSSVSVLCRYQDEMDISPDMITNISNYPDAPSTYADSPNEVPTESWYPKRAFRRNGVNKETQQDKSEEVSDNEIDAGLVDAGPADIFDDGYAGPMDEDSSEDELGSYSWGYQVAEKLKGLESSRDRSRWIHRSKLLLDGSDLISQIRAELGQKVKYLRRRKVIAGEIDLITDFLEGLFRHTRHEMQRQHQYDKYCPVEFVLCVPAAWTPRACRRMQTTMTVALRRTGFIEDKSHDVDNLFIVSEPEAAAAFVLAQSREIKVGCSFLMNDIRTENSLLTATGR
jgi:hypothetical protein